jgi:hypothetical protein
MPVEVGQVGRQRDALAAVGVGEARGRGVALVGLARADVHLDAVGEVAGGDHLADAARTTGDERGLARDGEERLQIHGGRP